MQLKPLPHYFIIKIEIEKQKERKEKIGSLYAHFNHVHMTRNLQNGIVVAKGSVAATQFQQVNISDTLIVHHFVEESNLIHSDSKYNYYNVTASEYNGHRCESYAAWNGKEIIPHPNFVFIEHEVKNKEVSTNDFIEQNTQQVGSLILFNNWEETREAKELRAQTITSEVKQLSKAKVIRDEVKTAIQEKEMEAEKITASLNRKEYIPYRVAYHNPEIKIKENVLALNMAANLELEFMDKTYIIVERKYCVGTN